MGKKVWGEWLLVVLLCLPEHNATPDSYPVSMGTDWLGYAFETSENLSTSRNPPLSVLPSTNKTNTELSSRF